MVSPVVAAKLGNQALQAGTNFLLSDIQVKLQRDAQAHRETMADISAALQTNSITHSEVEALDQSRRLEKQIDIASMQDKGQAEVNAAAAGVSGGSVDKVIRGLERSALNANYARIESLENTLNARGQDRKNVTLSRIFNRDTTVFQSPSVGASLLGLGTTLVDTYNQNQPRGQGLANKLSKLLGG